MVIIDSISCLKQGNSWDKFEKIKESFKKIIESGPKICIVPSPSRINDQTGEEWSDHPTVTYYRNWLESGKDLDNYYKHQQEGFPLFNK